MPTENDTTRRLAEISDPVAFERIAAAVLRAAKPLLYGNLSHPGVNPKGKAVKSLLDNIGWISSTDGSRLVGAAHTTDQTNLRGKWLHEPKNVKPKRKGSKPTQPAGDLPKAIAYIEKERQEHPNLAATLALTTNIEPSMELRVEAERRAGAAKIELDVWAVSRIAEFLDLNPAGQIIRRELLGTPAM